MPQMAVFFILNLNYLLDDPGMINLICKFFLADIFIMNFCHTDKFQLEITSNFYHTYV